MRKMKSVVALTVLLALIMPAAVFAQGQQAVVEEPEVFKYGFLSSLSGTFAGVAETQRKAFILAVEQKNAEGGLDMPWGNVPIETLIGDDEAKLDVGVRRLREMLDQGISALTGGIWNPMSAALNEESKVNPVIYIPGYVPALDIFKAGESAECTFTPTYTPWSIGYITGQAIVEELGLKTVYFLERADSWGATIREGLEFALAEYGGELIGTGSVSAGTVDYSPIINQAMSMGPDIFVSSMFGGDAIANLKQAYDMGMYDKMEMFSVWSANIVTKGIPGPALEGLYSLAWFYWNLEGFSDAELVESVTAYSDAFEERWNEPPDNMGTASYVASQIIFQAVEEAGSFDPQTVAAVIADGEFETVIGNVSFREISSQCISTRPICSREKLPRIRAGRSTSLMLLLHMEARTYSRRFLRWDTRHKRLSNETETGRIGRSLSDHNRQTFFIKKLL